MTTRAPRDIAEAIVAHAERDGQTIEQHLAQAQAHIGQIVDAAMGRTPRSTPIVCRECAGDGTLIERDSSHWSHPIDREVKCTSCDGSGRELCACGLPSVAVALESGAAICHKCLAVQP